MRPRHTPPADLAGRPFTAAQALAAGLTRDNLRAAWIRTLLRGVYAYAWATLTFEMWVRAALLVLPADAALSHLSALWCYDVRFGEDYRPLHFSTNSGRSCRQDGVVLHRRQGHLHPSTYNGFRVLGPDRTFVDSAAPRFGLSWVQLVQAGDRLVQLGHTTAARLTDFSHAVHIDGVQRARIAARYVRDGVESQMETVVRLMLICARLPQPACNVSVVDAAGRFVARCDLVFVRYRVIVEYDGRWHRRTHEQRSRDRRRIAELESLGWTVIVVTAEDMGQQQAVVARVHRALVANGYTGPDPHFNVMWMRWFA